MCTGSAVTLGTRLHGLVALPSPCAGTFRHLDSCSQLLSVLIAQVSLLRCSPLPAPSCVYTLFSVLGDCTSRALLVPLLPALLLPQRAPAGVLSEPCSALLWASSLWTGLPACWRAVSGALMLLSPLLDKRFLEELVSVLRGQFRLR